MKKVLLILALFTTSLLAQSPTAFRLLDLSGVGNYNSPEEFNAWAGAQLNYPIIGKEEKFDLSFGLSGKFVVDFTKFDLAGRTWNVLTYGNIGLPNFNNVNVFANTVSADEGINFGMQAYTIFGKLYKKSLTTSLLASTKINTFGNTQVLSYRLGLGAEVSLADAGLPLVVNVTPSYVILKNENEFATLQNEQVGSGIWTTDAYLILPIGDKVGALFQTTFAENVTPAFRLGVIVSAGLQ